MHIVKSAYEMMAGWLAAALPTPEREIAQMLRQKHRRQARAARRAVAYSPNGKHECERRRRQIAEGRITVSNGLEIRANV